MFYFLFHIDVIFLNVQKKIEQIASLCYVLFFTSPPPPPSSLPDSPSLLLGLTDSCTSSLCSLYDVFVIIRYMDSIVAGLIVQLNKLW